METPTERPKSFKHTDLRPGRTYNREYVGPHGDYKKAKGGETFKVISIGEKFVIEELYSSIGFETDKQHKREITFSAPENICKEYIVYECADPKKWFIHKIAMTLEEAIQSKAITVDAIKTVFRDQTGGFIRTDFVGYYENGKRYLQLGAEPTEKYPYLSSVVFLFKNTEDLKKQVREIFPGAWFM